jgi:hypothetical protein
MICGSSGQVAQTSRHLPIQIVNDKGRYHSHVVISLEDLSLLRCGSGKLDWIRAENAPLRERDVSSKADSWQEQPFSQAIGD